MHIVYAGQEVSCVMDAIFLAGPTPRSADVMSWRKEAIQLLHGMQFNGAVFVPEPEEGPFPDIDSQIEWEEKYLHYADPIMFWIPRNMQTMPALTTNIEWGVWQRSGKVVLGYPPESEHMKYIAYYAKKYNVPIFHTLEETLVRAVKMATEVPLT